MMLDFFTKIIDMQLLTSPNELQDAFTSCIDNYHMFYCCVAWAGNPNGFSIGKHLVKHSQKIRKAIIGLHFYQTHPEFIETFLRHKGIRYIREANGIFHDKIYLFVSTPRDWCAIIGSSNLTKGGFVKESKLLNLTTKRNGKGNTVHTI